MTSWSTGPPSTWPSTRSNRCAGRPTWAGPGWAIWSAWPEPDRCRAKASIAELLVIQLRDQYDELILNEAGVRAGGPESVHRMRVATRRFRSALATYRPWLRGRRWDEVRLELRWMGADLGRARDAEVLHARLEQDIGALPDELVVGPVVARVDRQLRARQATALAALRADLDGPRYVRLLDHLDDLLSDPPLAPKASGRAKAVLADRLVQEGQRVRHANAAFERCTQPARADLLLHEVRKAGKRARYAAESAAPILGRPAVRLARRMEKVQEVLGESQDSAAARVLIRHLVFQAHLADENCFSFGLVYGMEMARASEARASAGPAIRSALEALDGLRTR